MAKNNNTYEIAKRNFFKSMKKEIAVGYVYNNLCYKDQKRIIRELPNSFSKFFYVKDPLPSSLSSLAAKLQFVPNDLMNGLGCLVNQLLPYRKELNQYSQLKKDYENHLLLGDLDQCQIILDNIDKISLSIWSLEQRVLLAYKSGGSKSAIAYKDLIAEQTKVPITILLQLIWTKVEARYSLSPTEQQLYRAINEGEWSDGYSAYYKYFILKDRACYKFEDGLWFVLMTSVIDIYEYVLDIIVNKIQSMTRDDFAQIISMLKDLGNHIHDERLVALNLRLGICNQVLNNKEHDALLELYSLGDYCGVYDKALLYIIDNPSDFDIVDIYVKSAVFLKEEKINTGGVNEKSSLHQLLCCFFGYLRKGYDSLVSLGRLKVMANQMSSLKTGNCLNERIKYNELIDYGLEKYSMFIGYGSYSSEDKYDDNCYEIINDETLPVFIKQKAVSHWFRKLVEDRKDYESIQLYLAAYLNDPFNVEVVDTEKILKRHELMIQFLDYPALEASVFYALSNAPHYMYYHFFKKYIKAQKTQIPSKLLDDLKDDFSPLLEAFFYRVCSLDSIKGYIRQFPDSDSALNERLRILTKLSMIHRCDDYLEEMTEIKRKLNAKQRMQHLDQRMIFVDEIALKETELDEVKRQFKTYKETESTLETRQVLIEAEKIEPAEKMVEGNMKIKTERIKYKTYLFRQMFMEIRKQFLTSYKYGLDFYLSTRIRHGTFVRQMRRAFGDNKLITYKNDGEYKTDVVVSERILRLEGTQKEKVQELLKRFSKDIDDYFSYIKNEVIQVQAYDLQNQHPNAVFNYDSLNKETDITEFYLHNVSQITDYVEFVEVILAYLWSCTETLLDKMREKLDDIQKTLDKKIDDLLQDITKLVGDNCKINELQEIEIRVKTEMEQSINIVKMWFYRGQCDDDDFVIRDVIDACKESVSIHRNFAFEIDYRGECNAVLKGEYFRKMSDLMLILFNNIIDYNEQIGEQTINVVNVDNNNNDDIVIINVFNKLRNEDIVSKRQVVRETQEKFNQENYLKNSSQDKGYGLVKAYNMIQTMMPSDNKAFTIDVVDGSFVVSFKIDIKYWKANESTCC